jgi:hypothetical protein
MKLSVGLLVQRGFIIKMLRQRNISGVAETERVIGRVAETD